MSDEREAFIRVLRDHNIECTGIGEVSCRGCRERSWMSWFDYREHLADLLLAVAAPSPDTDEGLRKVSDPMEDRHPPSWYSETRRILESQPTGHSARCPLTRFRCLDLLDELDAHRSTPEAAPRPVHQFRPEPGDSACCAICKRTVVVWCDGYNTDFEAPPAEWRCVSETRVLTCTPLNPHGRLSECGWFCRCDHRLADHGREGCTSGCGCLVAPVPPAPSTGTGGEE